MKCQKFSTLIAYQNGLVDRKTEQHLEEHIRSCPVCQDKVRALENMTKILGRIQPLKTTEETAQCYDDFDIISYIESGLKGKARRAFFLHVAQCELCTNRLLVLERMWHKLEQKGLEVGKDGTFYHKIRVSKLE